MKFALIQVCVDDRLNHELLRTQIRNKLNELSIPNDHIFIVNELGGNFGENYRNTTTMITQTGSQILLAAVLHHDDCRAAQAGYRRPLDMTVSQMATYLAQAHIDCVLLSGQIQTASNLITWETEQRIPPGTAE
ncbi:MAG: hypothetical protein IT319_18635 [Anaerolineae bacterium]|nr:hypothetical protein [Anaerolineae bacterium]